MTPTAVQLARLQNGVTIEWLKPLSERDYNNLVENVDFIYINQNKPCSRDDGEPMDFSGMENANMLEWLIKEVGNTTSPDFRIYAENIVSRPTNIKDTDWPNYNKFVIEYSRVRLSNDQIIASIRNMEAQANAKVLAEGESAKAQMLSHDIYEAIANKQALTDDQQAVYNRLAQMNAIGLQNATNADSLIAVVNAGGTPDLDSGWITDTITSQGYPFTL